MKHKRFSSERLQNVNAEYVPLVESRPIRVSIDPFSNPDYYPTSLPRGLVDSRILTSLFRDIAACFGKRYLRTYQYYLAFCRLFRV